MSSIDDRQESPRWPAEPRRRSWGPAIYVVVTVAFWGTWLATMLVIRK
jgi:hypothetical protein